MRHILLSFCAALFVLTTVASAAQASDPAWAVRCKAHEKTGKEYCEMFQMITVKETGQRFVEIALFKGEGDKVGGIVVLPLGLLVAKPVLMQVDDGKKMAFNFHTCTPGGCLGRVNFNEEIVGQMRKGNELKIATHSQVGKAFNVKLSLNGFTKAYKELAKKSK